MPGSIEETYQILTFMLSDEIFGVDIMSVKEVLDYTKVTKVPQTPDFMMGVINLRGNVVPVIDLKLKFGITHTDRTVNTCIIIVEVQMEGESTVLGAMADSVQEVIDFGSDSVEDPPRIGTKLNTDFIKKMAKKGDEFVIILDIDKVFSVEELNSINIASED